MAGLVITGTAELWMLAALAGVTGAATGFFNPASTGLLPEIVPAQQLQQANALRATAVSAGEILGPLVAGLLVAVAGAGWAIAVDAAAFAVSAPCLTLLRISGRAQRETASFLSDLRAGWVAFRSRRWVWTFVAYFALGNMLWGAWSALGPIVAARDLGGAAAWGSVLAALGVGGGTGGVGSGRSRHRHQRGALAGLRTLRRRDPSRCRRTAHLPAPGGPHAGAESARPRLTDGYGRPLEQAQRSRS